MVNHKVIQCLPFLSLPCVSFAYLNPSKEVYIFTTTHLYSSRDMHCVALGGIQVLFT